MIKNLLGNLTSMLLALVLAVIIWAAAVRGSNPPGTKDFQLTVQTIERPDGIVMNSPEDRVQIRVSGPQNTLDTLTVGDFDAFIDLNGVNFGRTKVPIQIRFDEALEIDPTTIQIFPANTVEVELDQLVTVELPVRVNIQGNPAATHSVGKISADPTVVSVTGPATRLNVLKEARATVFLDNTRETRIVTRPLIFYDRQDNPVSLNSSEIDVSDGQSVVTVDIKELAGVADISIRVRWSGRPADGYRFLSAVPDPRTVLVQGPPDVIQELRSIPTEEIELSGLVESEIFRVALELPEGVTLRTTSPIDVEVEVERILTTDVFVATPQIVGLGEELSATLSITQVNVVLFGPLEALDTIEGSDVRVDVPLFGFGPGEYNIEPVVAPPPLEGVETRSYQPDLISVIIASTITETITDTESITGTGTITGTESLTPTEGEAEGYFYYSLPAEPMAAVPQVPTASAMLPPAFSPILRNANQKRLQSTVG